MKMVFEKLRLVKDPQYANEGDAGFDCFVPENLTARQFISQKCDVVLFDEKDGEMHEDIETGAPKVFALDVYPGEQVKIPLGLKFEIPEAMVLLCFDKSGVATKSKLHTMACVIDEKYRGEVHAVLLNTSSEKQRIKAGQKIVQLLLMPVSRALLEEGPVSEDTERGTGGFGSSGLGLDEKLTPQ